MASPNATFTSMVTTTLRHQVTDIADNNSRHNGLMTRLTKKGNVDTVGGGYELAYPIDFGGNGNYNRYEGYDPLSIGAYDPLTAAKYDWAQISIAVAASGKEIRMNSGEEQLIRLVKAKVASAMRDAKNNFSTDLYSSGSLTNQIGGLGLIIQTNGQGTVGGIDSATYSWWRNQFKEMTGTGTYAAIKSDMNALWLSCKRGADSPDLIVSTNDLYAAYEGVLQDLQRYTTEESAGAGFGSLRYKSAAVIHDVEDTNFTTTGERMYFLNTDYLKVVQHKEAKWTEETGRVPVNQDAVIIPILWMGQLVCTNRARQGVLIDAS